MRTETRLLFNEYLERQAELNGADPTDVRNGAKFTVDPSVQQKLNDKQQEDSSFLSRINIQQIDEQSGEALGLGIGSTLASRTNTATTDRATQDPSSLVSDSYTCKQTNSDTHLGYAKLDAWAKFKDFQKRISAQITRRQALDRIMIGFNGVSAAVATDRATYPLLQDVNIGWLKKIRDYSAGARLLAEGDVEEDKIIIGVGGDYANIDALVYDAVHNLLPAWARGDSELVAIVGADLLHDKYFPMVDADHDPSEKLAADVIISQKRMGGRQAASVPFMIDGGILITRFDNLSIYEQDGKRRRTIVDNAKRDQIQTFESSNDAYVIEDFDYACLIENIQFGLTP